VDIANSQKAICVETEQGTNSGGCDDPSQRDLHGTGLRKVAVILYIMFVWIYAMVLVINIGFAKQGRGYWFHEGEEGEAEAEGHAEGEAEGEAEAEG
jgi:hypothetical protein